MGASKFSRFRKRGFLNPSTPVLGSKAGEWHKALTYRFADRIAAQQAEALLKGTVTEEDLLKLSRPIDPSC